MSYWVLETTLTMDFDSEAAAIVAQDAMLTVFGELGDATVATRRFEEQEEEGPGHR